MRQTVGNACGTVGLLHAVGNITSEIKLGRLCKHSFLFINACSCACVWLFPFPITRDISSSEKMCISMKILVDVCACVLYNLTVAHQVFMEIIGVLLDRVLTKFYL